MQPASAASERGRAGRAAALVAVALAVVLALALAACRGSGGGGGAVLSTGRDLSPSTTTAVGPDGPATTVPTRPGAGAGAGTTTTVRPDPPAPAGTASPPTTAARGPVAAGPVAPAAPGRYVYDTSGQVVTALGPSPLPPTSTLVVHPPSGGRQRAVRTIGEAGGPSATTEWVSDYRDDGIYLVSLTQTVSVLVLSATQGLTPVAPVLLVPTGAGPGDRREFDAASTAGTAHVVVEVLRRETVTVGAGAVDTLVVRVLATLPEAGATADLTVWLAPAHGLYVREQSVLAAEAGRVEYQATLRSLTPA